LVAEERRPDPVLITDAPMSYEQQLAHRKSRYKIMMGMRIPLMIAAAAFYQYPWVAVALLVISIPLPWMAVLIANDRLPKKIVDPHRYQAGPAEHQAIEARPHPVVEERRELDP
jgi:hypothetical protein